MRPAILRISLAAVLLASGVGVSQLPGSPLRIASAQPFSVEVYNGFKDKTLPWNLSAVRRPDGSIYKQGRMVMTVTKPDSSQVVFEQLTDLDGNLRGQLYGGVVDQTGTYTLKAQVAGGGEEHSKAFRIADSADPAANTTYTGDNTFTGTTTFTQPIQATGGVDTNGAAITTDNGNVNVGTGNVTAALFVGSGASLTDLNASSVTSGTLADARLSPNATLQGNIFNSANRLVRLDGAGALPALNGSALTEVNADLLDGNDSTFYTNASNLGTGTLADGRLSPNVTLAGNAFNGVNQLVRLDASGFLPALNGSALTDLDAGSLSSGTVDDARLSGNVALLDRNAQTFSGGQAVFRNAVDSPTAFRIQNAAGTQTLFAADTTANLVTVSNIAGAGAGLTDLNATNVATGTLADGRLSGNVTLQGNTFNGAGQLVKLDGFGNQSISGSVTASGFSGSGTNLTALNASNISSGTLADGRLSSNVALRNADNNFSANQTVQGTVGATQFFAVPTVAGSGGLHVRKPSDTAQRWFARDDGAMVWGDGASAYDTNLYRNGADALATDDAFSATGKISGAGGLDLTSDSGMASGGIRFGSSVDTNLYRSEANTLKTDDRFEVGSNFSVAAAGNVTAPQIDVGDTRLTSGIVTAQTGNLILRSLSATGNVLLRPVSGGDTGALELSGSQAEFKTGNVKLTAGSLLFGSTSDTNLYRSAANELKTDDTFSAAGYKAGSGTGQSATCAAGEARTGAAYTGGILTTAGTCAAVGGGNSFVQGGNSFGAPATLGTNDNNALNLETNNATVASLSGSGAALFKNAADSATAFQIQNAAGLPLLVADTTNSQLQVGNPTADATATLLVLDTKNTAGDPSCVSGGVYYNSSSNTFRACQGGSWTNLISAVSIKCYVPAGVSFGSCTAGASSTWTAPAGITAVQVIAVGGGGGGGAGSGPGYTGGGGGGGGGAYASGFFSAADVGGSVTVTPGVGGSGGTANGAGSAGGTSTFGSILRAFGGGGGSGTTNHDGGGGSGGGGTAGAGNVGAVLTGGVGGNPLGAAASANAAGGSGAGGGGGSSAGGNAEYGGGGGGVGGGYYSGPAQSGGSSMHGAGGGGGGAACGYSGPGSGGSSGTYTAGGGSGGNGSTVMAGAGGAGGPNGNNGSIGGIPGAGGGGGAGCASLSGGAGGAGVIWVISW